MAWMKFTREKNAPAQMYLIASLLFKKKYDESEKHVKVQLINHNTIGKDILICMVAD